MCKRSKRWSAHKLTHMPCAIKPARRCTTYIATPMRGQRAGGEGYDTDASWLWFSYSSWVAWYFGATAAAAPAAPAAPAP